METSSFEHIVRIQFNALMMTVIKCTVKSKKRQFTRRSKREVLFCELSDMKQLEHRTMDNYSCDYISFEVLNYTIQVSNEKLAVALHKLSEKQRSVILLRYFQGMSDQEISELYHVSRSAIYRRRSNGLKKLKTVLKERNRTNEKRIRLPYIKNNMSSVGNETAIREILKFYDAYICKLCLRPFYHSESGKITMQVDEELKGQIHTEMMKVNISSVFTFIYPVVVPSLQP